MPSDEFADFMQRQREAEALKNNPIDWDKQRDEWLGYLGELYDTLLKSIDDYVKEGVIKVRREPIVITEQNIGRYEADKLLLTFGSNLLEFDPIGTLLVATKGRVDAKGPRGIARFILVADGSDGPKITVTISTNGVPPPAKPPVPEILHWHWRMVSRDPTPTRGPKFLPLTADLIRSTIMSISNG